MPEIVSGQRSVSNSFVVVCGVSVLAVVVTLSFPTRTQAGARDWLRKVESASHANSCNAFDSIVPLLEDAHEEVWPRVFAATTIATSTCRKPLPPRVGDGLLAAARPGNPVAVRRAALSAIARVRLTEATPELRLWLAHEADPTLALSIAQALAATTQDASVLAHRLEAAAAYWESRHDAGVRR